MFVKAEWLGKLVMIALYTGTVRLLCYCEVQM